MVRDHFEDERGGWFTTADDHEKLIARLKAPFDGALPSGNGVQALNLVRLAQLTGRRELAERAERAIQSVGALANQHPLAFSTLMLAVDWLQAGPREIVVAGDRDAQATREMLAAIRGTFRPQRVVALAGKRDAAQLMPLLADKSAGRVGARAYVCRDHACQAPIDDAQALKAEIAG